MTQLMAVPKKLKNCRQDKQVKGMHRNISPIPLKYIKTECGNLRPEKAARRALWVQNTNTGPIILILCMVYLTTLSLSPTTQRKTVRQ
jgi:hypothetical protein